MNTHMTTKEYREGYHAFDPAVTTISERRLLCPYAAGTTQAANWIEGWNDATPLASPNLEGDATE